LEPEDEAKAVTLMAERPAVSFPDVPAEVVQHAVLRSYQEFIGCSIRDFVRVLVERMAWNDLRAWLARLPAH